MLRRGYIYNITVLRGHVLPIFIYPLLSSVELNVSKPDGPAPCLALQMPQRSLSDMPFSQVDPRPLLDLATSPGPKGPYEFESLGKFKVGSDAVLEGSSESVQSTSSQ